MKVSSYEGICRFLEQGESFTAIMAVNDFAAIGVLSALHEHGLRVPDDISIVSFDDDAVASYLMPPLTSVRFDFNIQNKLASQFLLEQINDADYKHHQHVLLPDLIVRKSVQRPDDSSCIDRRSHQQQPHDKSLVEILFCPELS